ncbi:hypothetical protein B0H15DRAFT_223943 [Mycena belliarum]|uniref:Uncharacterized protein n=1 Tax=Mycena belliarum TaxID=1033014 RepID=A0AAD6XXZ2_9AGAR|nr:hypothetical protein B0H15DRAFT_223943 [Mycena belliae]
MFPTSDLSCSRQPERRPRQATTHPGPGIALHSCTRQHNSSAPSWRRAIAFAGSLQDGNAMLTENGVQNRAPAKFLETQHWLELVDA